MRFCSALNNIPRVSIIICTFHCYNNRKLGKTQQAWNINTCLEKYFSCVCLSHTWRNFCYTCHVMILRYYCYLKKEASIKHLISSANWACHFIFYYIISRFLALRKKCTYCTYYNDNNNFHKTWKLHLSETNHSSLYHNQL